ncbi:MAG: DNA primase, partial [SAR202 cluster bacterium]|nr:DNA primase [SAR202 cluster bacterium]
MALLDDVKQRLDMVDVASRYVQLQQSGKNFKARCPFHNEKTPSFYVFPETQTWRCFGACAAGGDAIGFVMRQEDLPFGEALRRLAREAGIAVPSAAPAAHINPLLQVNRETASFYRRYLLEAPQAEDARQYLARRGFTRASGDAFLLGLSPEDSNRLPQHLTGLGFSPELQVAAGVVIRSDDGRLRDRFRSRLMFAIADARGQVVGFSGRSLDGSEPKYMNSPKTPVFDKGSLLYGFHRAADAVRSSRVVVVVEGYADVIILHQEGFQNVVASMGTALTHQQVAALESIAGTCILALDPDAAGQEATFRSLETSWRVFQRPQQGRPRGGTVVYDRHRVVELKIAVLPDGKDPDELVLQRRDAWIEVVQGAKSLPEFLFETLPKRHDLSTPDGRRQVAERLGAFVVSLEPREQGKYVSQLERLVGIDRHTLDEVLGMSRGALLRQPGASARPKPSVGNAPFRKAVADPLERHAIKLLLRHPELAEDAQALLPDHFQGAEHRELFTTWRGHGTLEEIEKALDPALAQVLQQLLGASSGLDFPPQPREE